MTNDIFFSPSKITTKCMEQNLDITNLYYNEGLSIMNNFLQPIQNYNKMYGTEPQLTNLYLMKSSV